MVRCKKASQRKSSTIFSSCFSNRILLDQPLTMGFSMSLALGRQNTAAMVELYKRIHKKVDNKGNVSPLALNLLMMLQERGYDVKKLIEESS
jgi:hypothetical protein